MTREQALADFREHVLPTLVHKDKAAIREAWGIYTDALCKSGQITLKQYETWDNPPGSE